MCIQNIVSMRESEAEEIGNEGRLVIAAAEAAAAEAAIATALVVVLVVIVIVIKRLLRNCTFCQSVCLKTHRVYLCVVQSSIVSIQYQENSLPTNRFSSNSSSKIIIKRNRSTWCLCVDRIDCVKCANQWWLKIFIPVHLLTIFGIIIFRSAKQQCQQQQQQQQP